MFRCRLSLTRPTFVFCSRHSNQHWDEHVTPRNRGKLNSAIRSEVKLDRPSDPAVSRTSNLEFLAKRILVAPDSMIQPNHDQAVAILWDSPLCSRSSKQRIPMVVITGAIILPFPRMPHDALDSRKAPVAALQALHEPAQFLPLGLCGHPWQVHCAN